MLQKGDWVNTWYPTFHPFSPPQVNHMLYSVTFCNNYVVLILHHWLFSNPVFLRRHCLPCLRGNVPDMTTVYLRKKKPYCWSWSTIYFHNCLFLHRNLPSFSKDPPDTYISFILLPDKNRNTKRKTSVKKKSLKPEFNERLVRTFIKSLSDDIECRMLTIFHSLLQIRFWHVTWRS